MEHQDHGEPVQSQFWGRAGDSGHGAHLAVPGAGVTFMDRHPSLRERMSGLRGSRLLLMAGILVAPLVITGYVGLTVLLFLPLLGLRAMFPRRSTPSLLRPDGNAPLYSGGGNLWGATTRRA